MKRIFVASILILVLLVPYSFASRDEYYAMHEQMMGGQSQQQAGETPYKGGYYPCPMGGPGMMGYGGYGMMGYGMGPGMMRGMMGPGMMGYGGYGMMGPGMMGYGMGPGMMWGYDEDTYQKYMSETKDLRRKLHNKKFEYFEAVRNPDTKRESITELQQEIWDIQKKIYEKAPR
jgi:hypothetical protein